MGDVQDVGGTISVPHAVMLYTRDGTFQSSCDTLKSHAMCCDIFSNMLEFVLPILSRISQSFIIRFSNGFQHYDEDLMGFPVICGAKSSVKYF